MDYIPITLCDLAIISNNISSLGNWYVGRYEAKGISRDEDKLIVDPYVILLNTENVNYILCTYKQDTGYHLIVFMDCKEAEKYIRTLLQLLKINNKIVYNSFN